MAVIYIATNKINGKRYVGVTMHTLHIRRSQHRNDAITRHRRSWFHSAIRKYGFENFEWSEIFYCDDISEALLMEIKLIAEIRPEYNISAGGQGRRAPLSEHAKKRLMGNKNAKGNKSRLGGCNSQEARKKISESLKNSKKLNRKPVLCIETGEKFPSMAAAAENLGMGYSGISAVCRGTRKRNNGLTFKFIENISEAA